MSKLINKQMYQVIVYGDAGSWFEMVIAEDGEQAKKKVKDLFADNKKCLVEIRETFSGYIE